MIFSWGFSLSYSFIRCTYSSCFFILSSSSWVFSFFSSTASLGLILPMMSISMSGLTSFRKES